MSNRNLDQFYTSKKVSKKLYQKIQKLYNLDSFDCIFEPSAGTGAFYNLFPSNKRYGIDIDPKHDEIKQQDFLKMDKFKFSKEKVIVIGNPPFGKNASKAIQFVNHASKFSNVICFIVPKSFLKISIQNRINLNLHLKYQVDIEKNAFIFEDQTYDVPCVFQIWEYSSEPRKKIKLKTTHPDFKFVDQKKNDRVFIIQRVGKRAGQIITDQIRTSKNYYYIEPKNKDVLLKMKKLDLENCSEKYMTSGYPSLSKTDLIKLYSDI